MASLSIGKAARFLGVAVSTLRRWDHEGALAPSFRTVGGHRRYDMTVLMRMKGDAEDQRKTVAYARVSSHDQKKDLETQVNRLEAHCEVAYESTEVIRDLGSGLNYQKPGFRKLLKMILEGQVRRLVLMHKDRLLRYGAEIVFRLCHYYGTEIVILEEKESSFEETLTQDVIELMTVFSARLYGKRSADNRRKRIDEHRQLAMISA